MRHTSPFYYFPIAKKRKFQQVLWVGGARALGGWFSSPPHPRRAPDITFILFSVSRWESANVSWHGNSRLTIEWGQFACSREQNHPWLNPLFKQPHATQIADLIWKLHSLIKACFLEIALVCFKPSCRTLSLSTYWELGKRARLLIHVNGRNVRIEAASNVVVLINLRTAKEKTAIAIYCHRKQCFIMQKFLVNDMNVYFKQTSLLYTFYSLA